MTSSPRESRSGWSIFSAAATLLLCACVGDSITSVPKKGGIRNQPGTCSLGPLNNAWTSARLSGIRTQPAKCPYQVDVMNQNIIFSASLFGPKETTSFQGYATLLGIYSKLDSFPVVFGQDRNWQDDPNLSSGRMLEFTGNYTAAHYPAFGGPWSHDSGTVEVIGTIYGLASAYITLSGSAVINPGLLVLPPSIIAQVPATFRAMTDVDTNAYDFSWRVDGSAVPGNNNAKLTTTFSLPGAHTVTAFATNATGVDTITTTIVAQLNVAVNGPYTLTKNAGATYSVAVGAGGSLPYTYQWRKNGTLVGSAATYYYVASSCGIVSLTVYVTDSSGKTGSGGIDVQTTGGTCERL